MLVINKIDLVVDVRAIDLVSFPAKTKMVFISAKYGTGIDQLRNHIKEACLRDATIEPGRTIMPTVRQKIAFEKALAALERAAGELRHGGDSGLVMLDLNTAKEQLSKISGDGIGEDLLDQIFDQFCIGK